MSKINDQQVLHPRCKKAFSSFLTISENPLDKFFHFWLKIFARFFKSYGVKIKKIRLPNV